MTASLQIFRQTVILLLRKIKSIREIPHASVIHVDFGPQDKGPPASRRKGEAVPRAAGNGVHIVAE